MVDTCAAEFEASTPYFYSSFEKENEAGSLAGRKAVVVGSGPIRIGQGIEFDYCSVHSAWALEEAGLASIMVNSNPETVSTDFDTSSRLYFEPLDEESLRDILESEESTAVSVALSEGTLSDGNVIPVIVQFGGQTAINLSEPLSHTGHPIIGSSADTIDMAEDRRRFEDFLDGLGIPQPPGGSATSLEEAESIAQAIGYPVLVRPSYVLGGRGMEIVHDQRDLAGLVHEALQLGTRHPILVDKYLEGKEVEVDAVCDGERVLIPGIMEHIERAGVHSGDAMTVYPGIGLREDEVNNLVDCSIRIGLGLQVKGLMNVQFIVMRDGPDSRIYVLEVNPRASRTVPFISKVTGVPLVGIATRIMAGISLTDQGYQTGLCRTRGLVAIKAPVFSMSKLTGVDTYLGPEMKSTGEVMGVDHTFEAALTKALMAAGLMLPDQGALLLSIADRDKAEAAPMVEDLASMGYRLYATEGTAGMIERRGFSVNMVTKKLSQGHPNVVDIIQEGRVDAVVNTVTGQRTPLRDGFAIRRAAAEKRIACFTSLDTARVAIKSLMGRNRPFSVKPLRDYLRR